MTAPQPVPPADPELAHALVHLEGDRLDRLAEERRAVYAAGLPFPHVVLDDFLPAAVADRLLREFPPPASFRSESSLREPRRWGKRRSTREEEFTPFTREVLREFSAPAFLRFVSLLSGKPDLISDGDSAGALRHYGRGARLGVHADGNFHPGLRAWRRVNLILYLNRDWQDAYRGELELWDAAMRRCVARIAPRWNRAILFDVHETAYHGFPDALRCPRSTTRKTIQFYYYSREAPGPGVRAHDTLFRWRPSDRFSTLRLWQKALSRARGSRGEPR